MSENLKNQISSRKALFEVEHALSMYASSFCTVPAEYIYDTKALATIRDVIEKCHIYLIGVQPEVDFVGAEQDRNCLRLFFSIRGEEHILEETIEDSITLEKSGEQYFLRNDQGERFWPDAVSIQSRLSYQSKAITFEVKYIGQAYGRDGSRNAIDRLLKHETLQKIALTGISPGYRLTLLLLEVKPNIQLLTVFNPRAKYRDKGASRTNAGVEKLYGTTEKERIALYEASLIRYFSPAYNKEFKNSFPSTNLKLLQDCYEKDFSALIAEIYFDELPYMLFSESVAPNHYHMAKHDLHKSEARQIFFSLSGYGESAK